MNIVYLTQYAIDGQFQSQFYNYSRLIDKNKFNVSVYYLFGYKSDNSLIKNYKANGVDVKSLNFSNSRVSLKNFIKFIKVFSKLEVDIVHSQHPIAGLYNKLGITFLNLFYRKKIKIIVEQRCVKKNLSFFAQLSESLSHFLANLVLNSSDSVEKSYFNQVNDFNSFETKKKVKHITFYNSIETSNLKEYKKTRYENLINKDFVKLCFIGRLEDVKQPLLILKALKLIKEFEYKLYVAGEGSLEDNMKIFVKENGLQESVIFLGNIPWVPQLLNESDIFINYSKHEGLCKAVLEAMAVGVPVVASKVEGNIEIIGLNNEFGILSKSTDEKELKKSLLTLVTDYELYKKYSKKGIIRATDFDVKEQMKKIESIYLKI